MGVTEHIGKDEGLIYDVGMHKGEDADYYLQKGFRVIGFEADPDLVTHCRSRFRDEIGKGELIVVEGAIAEPLDGEPAGKSIKFYRNKVRSVWGTISRDLAHRNEFLGTSNETIEVPVVDFSECLEKYGVPHYLKIDIEGMDAVCLRALLRFEHKPDYVSMESEKVSFGKLVGELNLLTQLGYTRFKAIHQQFISRQREPNPSKERCYVGHKFEEGSSGLFGEDLPGEWKGYQQTLNEYNIIFLKYRLFGDYGILTKCFPGRVLVKLISRVVRKPTPGWYDTHCRHSAIVS
jgi:FkbM family methyltransferase